uniref:Xylulose kinase-1 n=1 Tax=Tanacetum cinerariifolium TaxID=118510 RepID=A0A699IG35_TANCI|nr:hypothetical protein [Tanacetum cinerariifolium]
MAPLTFADTHNMVAYLSKSDASEGFDQIVDFFNAHTIQYALVVNPTIYVSCIKQFWATAIVKKVNDVVVSKAIIRRDLYLDDADGVECLPNEEIFKELARMRYEKPPPKLTFYKAFFSAQWKFLIRTLVYMVRNVDSPSKFLMYPRFLQVVMDHQVDDMTSHNTKYTSPALTHKVFANMRRAKEEVKVPIAPSPPALHDPTPTPHATPLQDQPFIPHASLPQEQPTTTSKSFMHLLTTLMETCATLSQKVAELEQDKHSQALEILQLKKRVMKLEKKKKSKSSGFKRLRKIEAIDADDGITLVDVETAKEVVVMDAETQGRLHQEDFSAAEPTIAQKLHDEEIQKATVRDKQEKADMQRAIEIQKQYDDKEENIDWGAVIIRVRGIAEAYQSFEDMLRGFDIEDLVALWNLVKEKFSSAVPSEDKEKTLWVELKRQDIFVLTEKNYPFSNVVMILRLSGKLQVEEDNEMARALEKKIFMEANKRRSRTKDNAIQRLKENAQRNFCCWFNITTAGSRLVLLDKVDYCC